jgi:hypothetical protein
VELFLNYQRRDCDGIQQRLVLLPVRFAAAANLLLLQHIVSHMVVIMMHTSNNRRERAYSTYTAPVVSSMLAPPFFVCFMCLDAFSLCFIACDTCGPGRPQHIALE